MGTDPDGMATADPVAEVVVHGPRFDHRDGDGFVPLGRDQRHRGAEFVGRAAQHGQGGLADTGRVSARQRDRAGTGPVTAVGCAHDQVALGERDQDPVRDGAVDAQALRHVLHGESLRLRGDEFEGEQPTREGLGADGLARRPVPPPLGALGSAAPRTLCVRPRLVVAHPLSLRAWW